MFIIFFYIWIVLIVLGIVGGIVLWVSFGFWYGFFFVFIGVILLFGFIFLGMVGLVLQVLQDLDFDKVEKIFNLMFNFKWLYFMNKVYYYMLKGFIVIVCKDVLEGECYLKMVEEVEVLIDNEKVMLQIQLVQIVLSKGWVKEVKIYFKKVKGLKILEGLLKDQFCQLELVMNQSGQMKVVMCQGCGGYGMIGGKGKCCCLKMCQQFYLMFKVIWYFFFFLLLLFLLCGLLFWLCVQYVCMEEWVILVVINVSL